MEAHGLSPAAIAQQATGLLPRGLAASLVRRAGTISVSGVYGGEADPLPVLTLFDKQIQLRMGQANVRHWVDDILPLLNEDDPLGTEGFATHHVPLAEAPHAYEIFQAKQDGAVKILVNP
jgi:threonine dehydrogenase-like Zn-dependent dehydrogenase